ncbi:MAG: hypothetical protein QOI53_3978 [Verrucomicrobiota bacterium]|nr:hypothetical protein [Verrucomicrobiota bacterium]
MYQGIQLNGQRKPSCDAIERRKAWVSGSFVVSLLAEEPQKLRKERHGQQL